MEVSRQDFDKVTKKIKNDFSKNFKIIVSKRKDRNRAYFFIDPDGTVSTPVDNLDICRQVKTGNIFDKDILVKWKKISSEKHYVNNAEATFNYKF